MENKGHPLKSSFSFGSHFMVDYRLLIGARGEVSRSPGWWCLYYVRPGAWDRRSPSARLCCRQAALVRTALSSWTGFDCPATGWRLGRLVYTNEEASSQRCTADIWFGCPVDDVVRLEGEKRQDHRTFARTSPDLRGMVMAVLREAEDWTSAGFSPLNAVLSSWSQIPGVM
jgi:hypothetical protein